MSGFKVLFLTLVVVVYFSSGKAWLFGSGSSNNDDDDVYYYTHSHAELRRLYNARVVKAERWERPLNIGVSQRIKDELNLKHSGVVVTLHNGQRFLVHKGNEYGIAGQTVVAEANIMSGQWQRTESKSICCSTVGQYVAAGGTVYSLFTNNCHHASRRMMDTLY